jgi:pyridoxal/pyridoxine/pyridoxamine kinase
MILVLSGFLFEELIVDELFIAVKDQIPLLKAKKNVCGLLLDPTLPHNGALIELLEQIGHQKVEGVN